MDSLSLGQVISATNRVSGRRRNPVKPFQRRRSHTQTGGFRFRILSKKSDFQDFQGYAKPSHLLPAKEVRVWTDNSAEEFFKSFKEDGSQSLFKINIGTSDIYGSGLTDLNAGILLCLIGENGDSLLQRIPASLMADQTTKGGDMVDPDILHFQRGSVDEFIFEGPYLGGIEALWISLESGQWRLGSVSLTVICRCQLSLQKQDGDELKYDGFQYDFPTEGILLGEGAGISMTELRPSVARKLSRVDSTTVVGQSLSQPTSLTSYAISNEESMREYADLKVSLLFYDAMLIFAGTLVASFSAGESTALAFLTGGVGGFLYLLLLQRSVDGLPAPAAPESTKGEGSERMSVAFKGPVSRLALVIGIAFFVVKYSSGDFPLALTPKELIAGMVGFLACKVAVVLAALKPMPPDLKINE